ncbi:MAG: sulfur carrier protein ThiS [Candidatus Omnitrophica bacterium]|nr:sulfur carrier protein ThiS [Candidatus Omnitrophota bacterium]
MKIIINGKEKQLLGPNNLANAIKESCTDPEHVISEVNGKIIRSENWENFSLQENDKIELVTFVGGG